MTDISLAIAGLPEREQTLILRSACHVADESRLPARLHFRDGITDLDAARLIHAIERGATVVQGNSAWTDLGGALRTRMPHLTRVVQECLRLGLVRRSSVQTGPDAYRISLAVARVHRLRGGGSACRVHSNPDSMRRLRLSDDPALVDCQACSALTDE